MSQTGKKNLVITSIALYFTYFIHGIGASIMGQIRYPAGGQEQREGQRGGEGAQKILFHMEFSFPMFAAQSAAIWMVT